MTTIEEIARLSRNLRDFHTDWRKGQATFNALARLDPECAEALSGTPADPFHLDEHLPAFWTFVGERLNA